jgi:uncharacterized repeat protein (TIGR03943 family)
VTGVRAIRTIVLGSWAIFFASLWLTGDGARYLGDRTLWVIPFGAIATTAALLGIARRPTPGGTPPSETVGALALLAPIVAVLAVPNAQLGADAAERRAMDPQAAARIARSLPLSSLSYVHILAAAGHPQPGVEPGVRVRLVGFASRRRGTPPGMFQVTRFEINCCIADATALAITVDPPAAAPPDDAWLVVTGPLARRGKEFFIRAETVRTIPPPARPYFKGGQTIALPSNRHGTRPPEPAR